MGELTKEMMEEFWKEYEEHIKNNPLKRNRETNIEDYLIKDGIDLEKMDIYMNQGKEEQVEKVLFVFKESNDGEKGKKESKSIFDPGEWFGSYKTNRSDKKGVTKMIKWYKCILEVKRAQKEGTTINGDDIKKFPVDADDIYKFAFINMSKRGHGKEKSDDDFIKKVIQKDKKLLRKQVEYLQPSIVVIGGKKVSKYFEEEVLSGMNLKTIHVPHFAARRGYNSDWNAREESFIKQCEAIFQN